jgi:hypothetical protein
MNAHPDDYSMDDDLHDLSQAYRDATKYEDGQEPSSALDAAILAAAHRAVESRPQAVPPAHRPKRFVAHWRVPLSMAASFLVGVLVVMLFVATRPEPEMPILAQAPQMPQALPVPERPQLLQISPPAQAEAMEAHKAPAIAGAPAPSRLATRSPRAAAKEQMAEMSQPPESFALEGRMAEMRQSPESAAFVAEDAQAATTESRVVGMESVKEMNAVPVMQKMPPKWQKPQDWLEEIEKLRREGKIEEARKSLAEFRKHYPDHELPKALRNL